MKSHSDEDNDKCILCRQQVISNVEDYLMKMVTAYLMCPRRAVLGSCILVITMAIIGTQFMQPYLSPHRFCDELVVHHFLQHIQQRWPGHTVTVGEDRARLPPKFSLGAATSGSTFPRCHALLYARQGPNGPGVYQISITASDPKLNSSHHHGFAYMPGPQRIAPLPLP